LLIDWALAGAGCAVGRANVRQWRRARGARTGIEPACFSSRAV